MWFSELENITKIYNVHGISEFLKKDCFNVMIEEQEVIRHIDDKACVFYNYYISDYGYDVKMFMYGTPTRCIPTEEQVKEYFKEYYETYINKMI